LSSPPATHIPQARRSYTVKMFKDHEWFVFDVAKLLVIFLQLAFSILQLTAPSEGVAKTKLQWLNFVSGSLLFFYIMVIHEPFVLEWQVQVVLAFLVNVVMAMAALYLTYVVLVAEYASVSLSFKIPKQAAMYCRIVGFFACACYVAMIVGVILTDDLRFNALRHLGNLIVGTFAASYIEVSLLKLKKTIIISNQKRLARENSNISRRPSVKQTDVAIVESKEMAGKIPRRASTTQETIVRDRPEVSVSVSRRSITRPPSSPRKPKGIPSDKTEKPMCSSFSNISRKLSLPSSRIPNMNISKLAIASDASLSGYLSDKKASSPELATEAIEGAIAPVTPSMLVNSRIPQSTIIPKSNFQEKIGSLPRQSSRRKTSDFIGRKRQKSVILRKKWNLIMRKTLRKLNRLCVIFPVLGVIMVLIFTIAFLNQIAYGGVYSDMVRKEKETFDPVDETGYWIAILVLMAFQYYSYVPMPGWVVQIYTLNGLISCCEHKESEDDVLSNGRTSPAAPGSPRAIALTPRCS